MEQSTPVAVASFVIFVGVTVKPLQNFCRQKLGYNFVGRICCHNEEGSSKGSYYGNCYDDGIEEVADYAKAHTQGSDDEGEFADLRQAETAVHGDVEVLTCSQHAAGGEDKLANNGNCYENENGEPVLQEQGRVNQHTNGYEEHCTEQVFNRFYKMLDVFSVGSFCNQRTHNESTKCSREAHVSSKYYHAQAQTDGSND